MKTSNLLSAAVICSALLAVGCARTNSPSTKPTAAKPASEQGAPKAPSTDTLDLAGGSNSEAQTPGVEAQLPAGTLTTIAGGSLAAKTTSEAPPKAAPAVDTDAAKAQVTQQEILNYVDSLKLPAVVPFTAPKYDKKEQVKFMIGNACTKIIANAKKIGGVGNVVRSVPSELCNTSILRLGSQQLVVVPGKYISRKAQQGRIFEKMSDDVEVLLRANGTVAAVKTVKVIDGFFTKSRSEQVIIETPQGIHVESVSVSGTDTMTLENKDKSLTYIVRTKRATKYTPTTTEKSLTLKNYKGMHVSVVEESETQHSSVAGRVTRASVGCNMMVLEKDLSTALSASIDGRCFHRGP